MAKLEFLSQLAGETPKVESAPEHVAPGVLNDYSPKFDVEKADKLDSTVKALKAVMEGTQDIMSDPVIQKYTKILGILKGGK